MARSRPTRNEWIAIGLLGLLLISPFLVNAYKTYSHASGLREQDEMVQQQEDARHRALQDAAKRIQATGGRIN